MIAYCYRGEAIQLEELYNEYRREQYSEGLPGPDAVVNTKASFMKWFFDLKKKGLADYREEEFPSVERFAKKREEKRKKKLGEKVVEQYARSLPKKTSAKAKAELKRVYAASSEYRTALEKLVAQDPAIQGLHDPETLKNQYKLYLEEEERQLGKKVRNQLEVFETNILRERIRRIDLVHILEANREKTREYVQNELETKLTCGKLFYTAYEEWSGKTIREALGARNISRFLDSFEYYEEQAIAYIVTGEEFLGAFIMDYLWETDAKLSVLTMTEQEMDLFYEEYEEDCLRFTDEIEAQLRCSAAYVLTLLMHNPFYREIAESFYKKHRKQYEARISKEEELFKLQQEHALRQRLLKDSILSSMPERYIDLYPLARQMKRRFYLHIGPTNSGKTYQAMQALRRVAEDQEKEGIYLAPLRLLAYEQFESLNRDGFACNLITGEERILIPFANLQASTVEMADVKKHYAAAVIDEAQMINDNSRGGSWTAAILGLYCDEIHVCAAAHALPVLIRLIESCGDSYEIIEHKRQTPLMVEKNVYDFPESVRPHDALIVFSRRNVHAVASELQDRGIKCSIIYGNLPYDVRQEEARKFVKGETDVLVATDAIGMGMNLPVKRIVFLETSKFDGVKRRSLREEEVQQIAGRAGRRGMYDTGYAASTENVEYIRLCMDAVVAPIEKARISFPQSLLGIDAKLSDILIRWNSLQPEELFEKADAEETLRLCLELERFCEDKNLIYDFLTIPTDYSDPKIKEIWLSLFIAESRGEGGLYRQYLPEVQERTDAAYLQVLEQDYRICDLLYTYMDHCHRFEEFPDIMEMKLHISNQIMKILKKQKFGHKVCKVCGKPLSWNSLYSTCKRCSQLRRG